MNKAIDNFEEFLLVDLPTKIFPMERILNQTMFREDFFETKKDVEKYIKDHFKIFRREVRKMPISRKSFDSGKFATRFNNRVEHPVYKLLVSNPQTAFTVKEISKKTRMNEETVRGMLRSLKEEGLVLHKTPYFAIKNNSKKKK